jgi:UDP-glucose 4-epimerase
MDRSLAPQPLFHQCDLRDENALDGIFAEYEGQGGIWAVVHLAALKAVGESGDIPLDYYKVNVGGSLNLLEVCRAQGHFTSRLD